MTYRPGQFINLFVVDVNSHEVILVDSEKNEFVMPNSEQVHRLSVNAEVMVILFNEGQELLASMRLEQHANRSLSDYTQNDEVDLYIISETPLGFKCIINGSKIGMLYKNEVFTKIAIGQQLKGYIGKIREDHKIDLLLRAPGHRNTSDIGDKIIAELRKAGGFLALNDKTSPEKIYELFGTSKKKYKIALGQLYKLRLITISDEGLSLNS